MRKIGSLLALGTAVAIGVLTLYPDPQGAIRAAQTPLVCLVCGHHGGVDVLLNLILFLPLGVGIGLAGRRPRSAAVAAGLLSLAVETLQFAGVPGRDASLSDLLSNTAGGALGALLARHFGALALPGPPLARTLAAGCAAAWVAALALSAWLMAPGSSGGPLASNWAGRAPHPFPFAGTLRTVLLNGIELPPEGPPRDTGTVRATLDGGRNELVLRGVSGPAPGLDAWIYLLSAGTRPQLLVVQKRTRASIMVPARALRFRLRAPALALPGALPTEAGVAFDLSGGRRGHRLHLEVAHTGGRRAAELALSPAHGWVLIAPFGFVLGPSARLVTAGCIAAVLLPLGYWTAAMGRRSRALAFLAATLAAGLGAVPWLGGYDPVHWSEWMAGVVGAVAGWSLRHSAAYLEPRCGSPSISVSSSS